MNRDRETCPYCRKPVDLDDDSTVFRVLLPRGLSDEVKADALERAARREEENPASGVERDSYRLLGFGRVGRRDESDQVVAGHALQLAGARLVSFHPRCAEATADVPHEFQGEGWDR